MTTRESPGHSPGASIRTGFSAPGRRPASSWTERAACRARYLTPDPAARTRLHRRVTAAWMVFCVAHVVIMGPVYLADNVVLLGTLALVLNKPMLLAAFAGTWVWVRRTARTDDRAAER
ncbi:DUF3159 domain-containing protein [Nocardia sp. NPDC004654]|uniref:DUF3159 domain-containing protein n=1 Tax=Nocardia sp. NPDC004654 TaxID=3154776 RepID=UPI0033ACEF08